jgi:hypothetical protein
MEKQYKLSEPNVCSCGKARKIKFTKGYNGNYYRSGMYETCGSKDCIKVCMSRTSKLHNLREPRPFVQKTKHTMKSLYQAGVCKVCKEKTTRQNFYCDAHQGVAKRSSGYQNRILLHHSSRSSQEAKQFRREQVIKLLENAGIPVQSK